MEALLHSKVGSQPKPVPDVTETEAKIDREEVTGKESVKELVTRGTSYSRVAAKTSLANQRGIVICMGKIDLHTRTLVMLLEATQDLRRVMTKYDRPVHRDELMSNPDLNPYLAGYLPFASQMTVEEFFASKDRNYALQRWVLTKIPWNVNTFVPRMCDLLFTREYRIQYSYPGKQLLDNLAYIPAKLATFLYGVAELAAYDHGGADPDKVNDQLRVAFQASQVRKRKLPERDLDKVEKKRKRKKTRRGRKSSSIFTSSEEEEEDEELRVHEDFENTLVDYKSYLEEEDNGQMVDDTKADNESAMEEC